MDPGVQNAGGFMSEFQLLKVGQTAGMTFDPFLTQCSLTCRKVKKIALR